MEETSSFEIQLQGEDQTLLLGRALAAAIPAGTVISLCGTLGAGKTRLVKGIAEANGIDTSQVVSPTFSIVNHYVGRNRIHHLDVYRIVDEDEFFELGVDELFESDAITIVEWGDRFAELMPDDHLRIDIRLSESEDDHRTFVFTAIGDFDCRGIGNSVKNSALDASRGS